MRPRRPRAIAFLAAGVLLLVGFAPAAHLVAARLPAPPPEPVTIAGGTAKTDTTAVRLLPAGLGAGTTIGGVGDIHPYAVAALGVSGAQRLGDVLSSGAAVDPKTKPNPTSSWDIAYPYHYATFDDILAGAPQSQFSSGAIELAAALIKLAGRPQAARDIRNNAARAAYAVLDRTRATGGCDTALNLLLLIAADPASERQQLAAEYAHSAAACPDDPTPGWIAGQAQMRMRTDDSVPRPGPPDDDTKVALETSVATFEELVDRFPDDSWARTGLGDAYLRAGLRLLTAAPFTARNDLRLAVQHYNRAAELGNPHDADLGRARALIGLGDTEHAIELAERAAESPAPGAAMEVLLIAQQAAHDMIAAEDVARRLDAAGAAAYPRPRRSCRCR